MPTKHSSDRRKDNQRSSGGSRNSRRDTGSYRSSEHRSGSSRDTDTYRSRSENRRSENRRSYGSDRDDNARRSRSGNRRPYQQPRHDSNKIASVVIILIFAVVIIVCVFSMTKGLFKSGSKDTGDTEDVSSEESSEESEEEEAEEEEEAVTMAGLENVSTESIEVSTYFTYGTHFFMMGSMDTLPQVETMELVLRPVDQAVDLATYEMVIETSGDTTTYMSAETISEGPVLDSIPEGEYAWLIKLTATSGEVQYYTISDASGNEILEYYTITRDDANNLVTIDTMTDEVHGFDYFGVTVTATELPDDVYDFVVDPGHGGTDGGTTSVDGTYVESDMVLGCAETVYDLLTAAGYKVLMTRDATLGDDVWTAYNMYDEDGRVTVTCASMAKYCISIHINSNEDTTVTGYQIYGSCRSDYTLAMTIAENLGTYTTESASTMSDCYVSEGVYYNTYSGTLEDGLFTNVDILYMIREVGGIATGANQDGSTEEYNENIYRNSINCVESALAEIGFITNSSDLNNMIYNMDSYAEAIAQSYLDMAESITILDYADATEAVVNTVDEEEDDTDATDTEDETDSSEDGMDESETESSAEGE